MLLLLTFPRTMLTRYPLSDFNYFHNLYETITHALDPLHNCNNHYPLHDECRILVIHTTLYRYTYSPCTVQPRHVLYNNQHHQRLLLSRIYTHSCSAPFIIALPHQSVASCVQGAIPISQVCTNPHKGVRASVSQFASLLLFTAVRTILDFLRPYGSFAVLTIRTTKPRSLIFHSPSRSLRLFHNLIASSSAQI